MTTYDRANTPEYWNEKWSKRRRYEKYSMQLAWTKIKETQAKSVLDIGCGNGRLLYGVRDLDCFGIDISDIAIAHMKNVFRIDGIAMSVYDLDELDKKFDFIVCNHTLEHLTRDEYALKKIKNKLNIDGTFFCAVPNGISSPEDTDEHCQMYDSVSLKLLLTKIFGNCEIIVMHNHLIGISKYES
jgi:2-polyprenyl-3-methyl-5-hydroxy-6-metoxy-1,4-benzoquinol methylase